jgi:hypothetical protein
MREALRFIRAVREDEALRREIRALGHAPPLERLVEIGARLGCVFTPADLDTAFKRDAAVRWIFHTSRAARGAAPPSDEER